MRKNIQSLCKVKLKQVLILCGILYNILCCTDFSCAKTKNYAVNTWSDGNWKFSGFAVGPISGHHYHLLTSLSSYTCGIIKESETGIVQWKNYYNQRSCRSLVIDSTETNCYFVSNLNQKLAVANANCSDGSLINYKTTANLFRVRNDRFSMSISDTGNTIYMAGSIYNETSGKHRHCRYNTSSPALECANRPRVGTPGTSSDTVGVYTNSDDWMYMIAFDTIVGHYAVKIDSNLNYLWMIGIDCNTPNPSKCLASTNGYSDSDGTNIHSAYTLQDSPKYTLYFVLDIDTGSNATVVKRTNSDQDVEISSLYIDSNGVTWISLHTNSSSGYSELISYDRSAGNSTTYKQTGVAYFYQFVDPTNDNYWYGIAYKYDITEAKLNNMDYINILNVTTSSGGLIDADEDFDTYTSFPNKNSWVSPFEWSDLSNETTTLDVNITITIVDIPVEVQPNSTEEAGTNSTQETTTNSTTETNTTAAVEAAATASVAVVGATAGMACIAVIVTSTSAGAGAGGDSSSPSSGSKQSLWAMVNLYQEILFVPMLGTYLGDEFLYYITEFKITLFDFQFLKFVEIPVLESGSSIIDKLDFEQPIELFADNEFESGSAFFNCFQIFKFMIIFFLFNVAFLIYSCIVNKIRPERDIWYRIDDWFADFFHFTVYIRLLTESSMFIFISCMLEISQFDNISENKVSYTLAIITFILIFMFILIPIHYFKYCDKGTIETRYFAEIYDGFKDNHLSKLYIFIFILKRFLMAAVIVFMRDMNVLIRCIFFTAIQFFVLIYLIVVRPFDSKKNNLIGSINEITCLILCIIITIFNDESRWFDGLDGYLIYFLMLVGVVIGAIIDIDMIISCIQKCRERKTKKRAEQYLENDQCQIESQRRSTEEHVMRQETSPNQSYSNNRGHSNHKSIKQGEYSNIQNEIQVERVDVINNSR